MPVLLRLLGPLALTVLIGCATDRERPPQDVGHGDQEEGDPNSIEIKVGSASGIYGGPTSTERWVLRRTGECKGAVTNGHNAGTLPATTAEMELHSEEKYRECERLLRETRFFWMRDRVPQFQFESSTAWIEVRAGNRRHHVRVVSPEKPPAEFTRITEFVNKLGEQARDAKN